MTANSNIQYAWYEEALFRFRGLILILSILATVFFAYRASFVRPDTRLERLIPGSHEFVQNAREFLGAEQVGGSSIIRVAVERKDGTRRHFRYDWQEVAKYNPDYLAYVEAERERLGENHPLFLTQYRLLPIHGGGGFLSPQQRAQLQGDHTR